jgi:hypothetical protein
MIRRAFKLRLFLMSMALLFLVAATAPAGDFYRQLGIGYSAGYNAPAPYVQQSSHARCSGWWHWKSTCCQPGAAPVDCGCGCGGACADPCMPRCSAWLPRCTTCPPCVTNCPTCGTRNPGVY